MRFESRIAVSGSSASALQALERLRDAVAGQPHSAPLLSEYAIALAKSGRFKLALESAARASALQPTNPDVRYTHGHVLHLAGMHEEAIKELEVALRLRPSMVDAARVLASARLADAEFPVAGKGLGNMNAAKPAAAMRFTDRLSLAPSATSHLSPTVVASTPIESVLPGANPTRTANRAATNRAQSGRSPSVRRSGVGPDGKPVRASDLRTCPACHHPMAATARVCTHCDFGQAAPGDGRWEGGTEWQDLLLNVCLGIYILLGIAGASFSFRHGEIAALGGVMQYICNILALAVLFRMTWARGAFKVVLWINLLALIAIFLLALGKGWPAGVVGASIVIVYYGLMLYLVGYTMNEA
ncbi:MAG: tetratricopeptide repeat protein [Fimbriimonadaceae bacterium]|nr:tetratricopeptide repeat protein [Fimbriimonadaceae bacterium]